MQAGDFGRPMVFTFKTDNVVDDLTGAATLELEFRKPDKTLTGLLTATVVNPPGTDGKVSYTPGDGTFLIAGGWRVQGHQVNAGGEDFKTDVETFEVGQNIEDV